MLRALFRRRSPKRNNGAMQARSPRRNATRGLRAIVAAKRGGARWAARARKAINNRGRPAAGPRRYNNVVMEARSPRRGPRNYNNNVYVMYNGRVMTYNKMLQMEAYKRLLARGYSNNAARKISERNY